MTNIVDGVVYAAWDGQVRFIIEPYVNMLSIITLEQIKAAIPEHTGFGSVERLVFTDFSEFMTFTQTVEFALKEDAPPMFKRLQVFWEASRAADRDWRALWHLFLQTLNTDIREQWWKALNNVINPAVAAPPELAKPLPEGEELDNLPEDSPLSVSGKPSKRKPSTSSRRKDKQSVSAVQ